MGVALHPDAIKGEMLILLRQYYEMETSSQTMTLIGKHKGLSYEEIQQKDPSYLQWAIEESKSKETHILKALAAWADRVRKGEPKPVAVPSAKDTQALASKGSASSASTTSFELVDAAVDARNQKIQQLEAELQNLKDVTLSSKDRKVHTSEATMSNA